MSQSQPMRLREITVGANLDGVSPAGPVKVISVESHGTSGGLSRMVTMVELREPLAPVRSRSCMHACSAMARWRTI